jgi:regulator of sirC expression with transglutaminase-like and TPR domain
MNVISIDQLPSEVISIVIEMLEIDPGSLYRLSCSCRYFFKRVMVPDNVIDNAWKRMYHRRWKTVRDVQSLDWTEEFSDSSRTNVNVYKHEFKRRFVQDKEIFHMLSTSNRLKKPFFRSITLDYPTALRAPRNDILDMNSNMHRMETKETLIRLATQDTNLIASAYHVTEGDGKIRLIRNLAAHLVHEIDYFQFLVDWSTLWNGPSLDVTDSNLLEHGVILLSRFIHAFENSNDDAVTQYLNEIGQQLEIRMSQIVYLSSTSKSQERVMQGFQLLNELLLNDLGFEGNTTDYYNLKNSSIEYLLNNKKGIPIMLAIVYKLILHRVHIHSEIIGLPGHVVLGLPINDDGGDISTYIDVFDGGKLLSLQNCRDIASRTCFMWDPNFADPVTVDYILKRMVNNIVQSSSRDVVIGGGRPTIVKLKRVDSMASIVHNRVDNATEQVQRIRQILQSDVAMHS